MKISIAYSRFFHGVVLKEFRQINQGIVFHERFKLNPTKVTLDNLKQMLKYLNLDYPKKDGIPLSTTEISNKELQEHIEFTIKVLADNGLTYPHIDLEWARLILQYDR